MTGTRNVVADIETSRPSRFPAAIVLSTAQALDLLAAAEDGAAALARVGHGELSLELTHATSALIATLFRNFPTVSE